MKLVEHLAIFGVRMGRRSSVPAWGHLTNARPYTFASLSLLPSIREFVFSKSALRSCGRLWVQLIGGTSFFPPYLRSQATRGNNLGWHRWAPFAGPCTQPSSILRTSSVLFSYLSFYLCASFCTFFLLNRGCDFFCLPRPPLAFPDLPHGISQTQLVISTKPNGTRRIYGELLCPHKRLGR